MKYRPVTLKASAGLPILLDMHDRLRSENQSLRRQLETLLQEARRNEEKMRRFDRLERRLIGTRCLPDLVGMLLTDYQTAFDLDAVGLTLIDPEYEIARLLAVEAEPGDRPGLQLPATGEDLERLYGSEPAPLLAAFDPARHGFLFPGTAPPPASLALLPLASQGCLIGSFNLASRVPERFGADCGTEFLARLAAVAALSLENALNHERLRLVGLTDPLTGVNNRRYFEARLQEEITRARRHDLPLACMFVDIDRFKRINDGHGHPVGDEALRQVAALVKAQLRGSDIIARYGGEEFVVLLPQTAIRHASDIAERIRARVAAAALPTAAGAVLRMTVSIGVAALPAGAGDEAGLARRLVERADHALYRAKQSGRNRVVGEADPPPRPFSLRNAFCAVLR